MLIGRASDGAVLEIGILGSGSRDKRPDSVRQQGKSLIG